ncbi:uncharacterized protein Hap1MRO34_022326 [Clarias gariepinus]|uniref:cilia- and flagella-associated protein 97-like n=1 Tax=Clarias gariepinus TaxID=13013 RepID=UPI00234D62CB|nr:cilia- and flagella-associated protein 97-like [Clarias gariepinus]
MYSSKELEGGEVDQPFQDSNCDVIGTIPEEPIHQETEDRDITNEEHLDQTETSEITREVEKPESVKEEIKETIKPECEVESLEKEMSRLEVEQGLIVKDDSERKEDGVQKDEAIHGRGDSATSSEKSSPLTCSELTHSIHGIQLEGLSSMSPSSALAGEEDGLVFKSMEDSYHHTEPGKESTGNFHTWNQRHLTSSSSSSRESTPTPLTTLFNEQSSLSSQQQTGPESDHWKQCPRTSDMAISDDTVTGVTPLSSPDINLQRLFDLAPPTSSESTLPKDTTGSTNARQLDANTARGKRSAVLCTHRKMDRVSTPGKPSISTSRRSNTRWQCTTCPFTSDTARRVERKNQHHQRELCQSSTRGSSHSGSHSYMPLLRPYHSGLNRQRDQRRIQRENVAIRKRLEAVRPTPGMTRIEQLTDYQRQAGYLGIPTAPFRSTSAYSEEE